MAIVKSHLCKQCGGLLDIDTDRQVYVCSYCGVTFDYEYFREDNVKDIARKSVSRNEFGAAKDAYEFVLAKDPHDFDALLGLFLSDIKWQSLRPIRDHSNVHFTENNEKLKYAIDNCAPQDKPYFERIRELARLAGLYQKNRSELGRLDGARKEKETEHLDLQRDYSYNEHGFTIFWNELSQMTDHKGCPVLLDLFWIALLVVVSGAYMFRWGVLILLAILIVPAVIGYNIRKLIVRRMLKASIRPVKEQLDKCVDDCNNKVQEGSEILKQYGAIAKELIKEQPATGADRKDQE